MPSLAAAVPSLIALALVAAPLAAQNPGEVLRYQKISATAGKGPRQIQSFDQFGRGAAVIGDLDLDGVVDLAVGAMGDDDLEQATTKDYGAVWILFMQSDGKVKSYKKIGRTPSGLPLDPGDEFGRSVRELGDFDLDGIPDIVVSANYDDDNGTDKGAFYLLFLNRDGTVKSWKKISELSGGFTGKLDPGDQFGRGLRLLGDLDLDGVEDLGVGAIRDDDGGSNRGCYWILFMKRDGTVKAWSKLSETKGNFQSTLSDSGEFGFDCTLLGDRNGDGIQDIAICAPDQRTDNLQQGAVFVVYLDRDGTAKADFRIAENKAGFNGNMLDYNDEFGCCIDAIGDLDRDGFGDIAVGAGKDDDGLPGSVDKGAVYILFLNGDATVKSWQKISSLYGRFRAPIDSQDRFGTSIACPGDLNGDGINDLFVGTRFDDDGGSGTGAEYFLALNDGRFTPPTADFTGAPRRGPAPLAVQFVDQSTGDVSSWSWTFGDGGTSTEQHPLHTYTIAGTYTVSLGVAGPAGDDSITFTTVIKVDPPLAPLAGFSGTPTTGEQPLVVQFTDSTLGWVTGWWWDFGDGTGSGDRDPQHVYAAPGSYTVALTATGPGGSNTQTRTAYVEVLPAPAPTAEFAVVPSAGLAPLAVQFTDLSAGPVTSWSWDFGDGSGSSAQNPEHTYTLVGTHDVSLSVSGPGGTDVETKLGSVEVGMPPAPVAEFTAVPLGGSAPLFVTFADLSSGAATSWAWDFGDGAGSSDRNPSHLYVQPGDYTVALVTSGPGGSDVETKFGFVSVATIRRGILDPSFELQSAGGLPAMPWTPFFGAEHRIEPSLIARDGLMPTEGAQWCLLSAAGTHASIPPTNPGGPTLPAIGGAGVSQSFYLEEALSQLEFDAAFVRNGPAGDAARNDWMSVDVSDGLTTVNLFYADTFSPAAGTSALLGLPMTAVSEVSVDLRALFPGSSPDTLFTLQIQVGNGGDGALSSCALVDDFRLEQAPGTAWRYGCGVNPARSLTVVNGAPRLGSTVVFGLDNPLGTQGRSSTTLYMSLKPDPLFPCGTLAPGLGMSGAGQPGEWLVSRVAPDLLKKVAGSVWTVPGSPALASVAMPTSPSWIGSSFYVQGFLLDPAVTYGVRVGLTDALKLLIAP